MRSRCYFGGVPATQGRHVVKNAAEHTELMSVDPLLVGGIAETTTAVGDSVTPQFAAEIAVRAGDSNSIIAIIMEIGHLDRAPAHQLAEAIDVYLRTGVIDHGPVSKPAMSGALRVVLAALTRPRRYARCPSQRVASVMPAAPR